jgi:hypothetical protein
MVSAVTLVIAAAVIGVNADYMPSRERRPERARRRISHEDDDETRPCTTSFTMSTYDSIVMDIATLIDGASDEDDGVTRSHVRKLPRYIEPLHVRNVAFPQREFADRIDHRFPPKYHLAIIVTHFRSRGASCDSPHTISWTTILGGMRPWEPTVASMLIIRIMPDSNRYGVAIAT